MKGYPQKRAGGTTVRVHRLVWEQAHGPIPAGMVIDHINGDKRDNRLENLRLASKAQNAINSGTPRNSTTGVRGVALKRGKYRAYLTVSGTQHTLGTFATLEEAAEARRGAERAHFGSFARG